MRRLGSVVLASVLLGVPRALDARVFGAQRSVYVEVSPLLPELAAFADALEEAIGRSACTLARSPREAAVVVSVLSVAATTDGSGRPAEAVTVSVREGRRERRIVLHGGPDRRGAAARQLVGRLSAVSVES